MILFIWLDWNHKTKIFTIVQCIVDVETRTIHLKSCLCANKRKKNSSEANKIIKHTFSYFNLTVSYLRFLNHFLYRKQLHFPLNWFQFCSFRTEIIYQFCAVCVCVIFNQMFLKVAKFKLQNIIDKANDFLATVCE